MFENIEMSFVILCFMKYKIYGYYIKCLINGKLLSRTGWDDLHFEFDLFSIDDILGA